MAEPKSTTQRELSFVRHEKHGPCFFYVEPLLDQTRESRHAAERAGFAAALELLDNLRDGMNPRPSLAHLVPDLAAALETGGGEKAYAFLRVLDVLIEGVAKHLDYSAVVATLHAEAERSLAFFLELERKEKQAFAERMRAAKARKLKAAA